MKQLKIGTLNCRGMRTEVKKMNIADDMAAYDLSILGLQETHLADKEVEQIRSTDGTKTYTIYHSGTAGETRAGVAIVMKENIKCTFTPVSGRICMMKITMKESENMNRPIYVINCYAPTEPVCEQKPELRETFYGEISSLINTICKRAILLVLGDFNAKTGSGYHLNRKVMGPYGKGRLNDNGKGLLEFASEQSLVLTNTLFDHKLSHVTTWESPFRQTKMKDGTDRRNPFRNQIDYILIRQSCRELVRNSRSHNGINTFTDHRLVKMTMYLENHGTKKRTTEIIDYQRLRDPVTEAQYAFAVELKLMDREDNRSREANQQQRWDDIVIANKEAAEEILGHIRSKKVSQDHNIVRLSKEQKHLGERRNTERDPNKRDELRQERNRKITELHKRVKEKEHEKIITLVRAIEECKDDSRRMFQAVRALQTTNVKKPLVVETGAGTTTDTKEQIRIIGQYFDSLFYKDDVPTMPDIPPAAMTEPFTGPEIEKALKKMRDNKSAGVDDLKPEQLKKGPSVVFEEIANIFNTMAATGEHPSEIKAGLLVPLQKPGKSKGPVENLRPIILLSVLRKLLAICLIGRVGEKIDSNIPNTQAAYRFGRSTTEQVFAIKIMAEKAVTSANYSATLLMMDMSKAFDSIHRSVIMEDLSSILLPEEVHLIKIRIEEVKLSVKVGREVGEPFDTNIGTPQGDCLSPILFTLYLANALKEENKGNTPIEMTDHNYATKEKDRPLLIPDELKDHSYSKQRDIGTLIDLQYADDICWIGGNCDHGVKFYKETIPSKLAHRNLEINQTKTEEYTIHKDTQEWKKCRYLGSLLDTEEDINRRKRLARAAYDKVRAALEDRKLDNSIKISIFRTMISSVFLYNSEIWTLTKTMQDRVDSFQRSILRRILNIRYPRKISNIDLYNITGDTPWSEKIKQRRLSFFGHLSRLPEEAPAKQAIQEFMNKKTKKRRGGQKLTWIKLVEKDIQPLGITIEQAQILSQNRKEWRSHIEPLT